MIAGADLVCLIIYPQAVPFLLYLFLLICFHMAEYLLTAAFRPDVLSFDNFLLNHSLPYQAMVVVSWFEYWLEFSLGVPGCSACKQWGVRNTVGLAVCLVGLLSRMLAMATASSNFSHIIEQERRCEHRLVTTGIYAVLRHPAYFGFFWFSIGTQLLLANPICLLAYTAASWHFFFDRIPYEEQLLVHFFGDEYLEYRKRTWIGIPLMSWFTRAAH
uniref:Protein-S-isoprenylcysteine O-methyltransferase n=1 Tax=Coccolithus braarudii TaxID=221442 RepID=A0A7S0LDN9_9EUKA